MTGDILDLFHHLIHLEACFRLYCLEDHHEDCWEERHDFWWYHYEFPCPDRVTLPVIRRSPPGRFS